METAAGVGHDRPMPAIDQHTDDQRALLSSAYQLQRAAGKVLKHGGGADSPQTLATTLAHVEEAIDRLSVGMLRLERVAAESLDPEPGTRPEAEALSFHLRRVADKLASAETACQASRGWARRLLEAETTDTGDAEALALSGTASEGA
jgi:hypothetical protein